MLEWPYDNQERTRWLLHHLQTDDSPQALRLAIKLSREPGTTLETVAVREMAVQCLAVMQERRERTKQSRTLLRGSEAPTTPSTLLRPVQTTPSETPSEQLLRPAHPDSNG
jgi:hypothetical protein